VAAAAEGGGTAGEELWTQAGASGVQVAYKEIGHNTFFWYCYMTVNPETHTHQNSEHNKKHHMLITFIFLS
jgi:hypothetical protein